MPSCFMSGLPAHSVQELNVSTVTMGKMIIIYGIEVSNILFYVSVINCSDLPGLDRKGSSNPFVTAELNPKTLFPQSRTKKTRAIHQQLNPDFHETFEL